MILYACFGVCGVSVVMTVNLKSQMEIAKEFDLVFNFNELRVCEMTN